MRLRDKVALVTGAAGGIGVATARRLAEEGAIVVGTDVGKPCGGLPADAHLLELDVTDEATWPLVVAETIKKFGRIDVLVTAAGIEGNVLDSSPLCDFAEWKKVLSVNLDGTFLAIRAVLPGMLERGTGSIVTISSLAHYVGLPMTVPYAVSKSGVWNLSRAVATYAATQGTKVRCNSVHPGMIETRMLNEIGASLRKMHNLDAPVDGPKVPPNVLFGEPGTPDDIGNLIAYLASDESSYVTGSEFRVDGGWGLWYNGR